MKCLILAAGYATRLYPLTANFPKPLLPIKQDATILDRLMEDLKRNVGIEEFIVVTNHKFVILFEAWKKEREKEGYRITILDDGTKTNETRLGAVKDMELAVNSNLSSHSLPHTFPAFAQMEGIFSTKIRKRLQISSLHLFLYFFCLSRID